MPDSEIQSVAAESGRIRVLFVAKRVIGGGAERVITALARHLNRSEFEPHLATISIDAYQQDIPPDVVIHRINANELRWAIPQIAALVRHVRPHVVLSTLTETNVAVLLARPFFPANTKVIVREAVNPSAMLEHMLPFPFLWRRAYRHLYPRADAIVCQSRAMQADMLRHVPIASNKAHQIYNGVDVALIERRAAGPSPYRDRGPNLLAAGRLSPEKNFSLLLDAFTSIRGAFPSVRLTILGSGPEEALLKAKARELQVDRSVDFAGFQDNPFPYYRHADLYLQTSLFEGLPNVLLEVLSLGTPAVATVAGGATEEVAEVAGGVRLVREPGVKAYADAILEALGRPHPALRRETFLQVFSVERMMTQYQSLLAIVAGKAPVDVIQVVGAEVRPSR